MKKIAVCSWILLAVSVILGVVAYIILPDTIVTQLSVGSSNPTTMPKLLAVLVPFVLGVGGALLTIFGKGDDKSRVKSLIISAVAIVIYAFMFVVNL